MGEGKNMGRIVSVFQSASRRFASLNRRADIQSSRALSAGLTGKRLSLFEKNLRGEIAKVRMS